ncbi:histidinol-phosphate aminotransferase [Candidatus Blochmanniella vafra str. BVAF]|uniref:Histidinol-phosphate aminotransferase n=1 Tax=Blochmanniella vafra (strain BVAF) TaxID=859654 RepID=E8Q727_BLOVB|nr:histidinol-phosphate transaminase [Candidatus Blochmannia vafer]ADV33851.1 histidinol-phosphate aminotransferase [Candidatus Blochmannia vafer str. BVAF]
MNIHCLVRNQILTLQPYQSARKFEYSGKIWLNANEHPIAPHYKYSNTNNLNRYPMCQPKELIHNYATYSGVQNNQVLVSRGSDEGIELLMKVFCDPNKDTIIFCPPTYGMYKTSAEILGINYRMIPTINNWQLNLSSIASQLNHVKLIYICHPNNPTGNIININSIIKLLKIVENKALLIIDEAYIDFCSNNSLVKLLSIHPNLIILRTLSKAFALAGLRCGFTLANAEIIKLLKKVIAPYPIPTPVIDIATQALTPEGIKYTQIRIKQIHNNRHILIEGLKRCSCVQTIFPSCTNYILVKFTPKYQVFKKLLQQGIILRDQSYQWGLTNCLRITIGSYEECQQIISILQNEQFYT